MNIIGKAMSFAVSLAVASAALGAELSKSVPKGWDEDFEAGKATAEKSGKLILLAFSGSDWCGWCVKMEKEIYSDKKFISEAKKKFVLLMIDNPQNKSILSPLAAKQNSCFGSDLTEGLARGVDHIPLALDFAFFSHISGHIALPP